MKTHTLEKTKNKDLFRVVDLEGNWQNYLHQPSGRYLKGVTTILDRGYAKGAFFNNWLLSKSKEEADKILQTAGDRGDKVHKAIAKLLETKGKIDFKTFTVQDPETKIETLLNVDEWKCLLSFARFWNDHACIVMAQEFPLFSLKQGFAGTCDAAVAITKPCDNKRCQCPNFVKSLGLWDWKTSGAIYASYGCQIAAYNEAENLLEYTKVKPKYTANLRLGTKHNSGYELVIYDAKETKNHWHEFLSAKMIASGF